MTKKCYFTFPNTHQAIRAEKALAKENLEYKMVPVPRSISSSCGIALCCLPGDARFIREYLAEHSITAEGFFELEEKVSSGPLSFLSKRRN